RGALKLVGALDGFGFDACGVRALDVGASTGGFTQVLLERGADEVVAVDVGRGQLAPVIAADRRVVSFENTDARQLAALGERVRNRTAFVCDVSFISVLKVLPHVLPLAGATAWLVVLVKPQVEVGRAYIGKGGIVRDEEQRLAAVRGVETYLTDQSGWRVIGHMPSEIAGGDGNQEYLVGATYE
ncbi:MAG: SAM-dependent methyltransferase, partial [Pseudomonadota bacterium]